MDVHESKGERQEDMKLGSLSVCYTCLSSMFANVYKVTQARRANLDQVFSGKQPHCPYTRGTC